MANHEIPEAFISAFQSEAPRFSFPKRSLKEKIRGVQEATPTQIAIWNQARSYLKPYEETLKHWAITAMPIETRKKIVSRRTNSRERFPVVSADIPGSSVLVVATPALDFKVIQVDNGVFVFNKSGQITKIILMDQPRYHLIRDSYINIANPRELAVFDGDENKKYPVRPDGLCMYGNREGDLRSDTQRFLRSVDTFTEEALSPLLNS